MPKKVYVFYGKKGSGKDACREFVEEVYGRRTGRYSFAYVLKEVVWKLFEDKIKNKQRLIGDINFKEEEIEDWEIPTIIRRMYSIPEEKWTGRRLLQWFGTEICRTMFSDVWVRALIKDLVEYEHLYDCITITDCRFQNEYDALKNEVPQKGYEVIFVEVKRDNLPQNQFGEHISEKGMDDFKADYVIENNGTLDELREKVLPIIKKK